MKASFYISIAILLITIPINAQQGWFYQDSGTTDNFLCVYFIDTDYGWVGSKQGKIYNTTNGGENWNLQITNSNKDIPSIYFINRDTGWCVSSSFGGSGEGDIYKTTDGGINWVQKFTSTNVLQSISFANQYLGWAVGTAYFVGGQSFKSTNGGESWFVDSTFVNPVRPRDVYFLDESVGFIVGGESPGRIFRTIDGGITWDEAQIEGYYFSDVSFSDSIHGMATGWTNSMVRTFDGGENWDEFQTTIMIGFYGIACQFPLSWTISGSPTFILSTSDFGDKWFPQFKFDEGSFLYLTDIYFVDDSCGWAVGPDGKILKTINGGVPEVGAPQIPIVISPEDGDTLETRDAIFRWNELEYSIYQLQICPDSFFVNNTIDIRTLYINYGTQLGDSSKYYWRIRSENINGYSDWSPIRSFTTGWGILDVENEEELSTFSLSQNYPNPFNPTTKIHYTIPAGTSRQGGTVSVQLKVYDVLGKEVAILINEEKPFGEYEVEFDASDLTSGIYFYQLKAGSFVETKKMVLMK